MRYQIPAILLLATLVLAACSQNPIGIFESIELEREIEDDRLLPNELNIGAIDEAGDYYFIAAGSLYYRLSEDPVYVANDRSQWQIAPPPGTATNNYTSTSLVSTNLGGSTRVFAVFSNQAGTDSQLVEISATAPGDASTARFGTSDTGTGGTVVDSLGKVFAVDEDLNGTDDYIVVVAQFDGTLTYGLFASSDGLTFTEIDGTSTRRSYPFVDVITTGIANDGNLYIGAGGLIHDPDGIVSAGGLATPTTAKAGSQVYTGGIYDSVGSLAWLADNNGYLYSAGSTDLTAWTQSSQVQRTASNDTIVPFTDFASVPVGPAAASTILLVGTQGYGYRVVGTAGSVTAATAASEVTTAPGEFILSDPSADDSNYEASDLSDAVVNTFYVNPVVQPDEPVPTAAGNPYELFTGYVYFAGTSSQGLWRALSYTGSVQWIRE